MLKNKYIVVGLLILTVGLIYFYLRKNKMGTLADLTRNILPNVDGFRYFKLSEFDATASYPIDAGKEIYQNAIGKNKLKDSGKNTMKLVVVKMLDDAREIIENEWNAKKTPAEKIVLTIESGVRTQHYNDSLPNSVKNSAHVTGYAVDLIFKGYTTEQQTVMLEALKRVGFNRFGMGVNTVHVDADPTKPKNAVWHYSGNTIKINPLKLK